MKIRSAFPRILDRQYAFVMPEYPLLTILYFLRMKDVDAVPIRYDDSGRNNRAVFGFSSLLQFVSLGPKRFRDLLREPCERASDELPLISVSDDLESLFDAFAARRLGFALVHGVGVDKTKRSLIGLRDVLGLYKRKIINTELLVRDVAAPIFSMPRTTPIRSALQAMFRHGYRRVFISEREYISDRSVMLYLFSPTYLEEELDRGSDPLAARIDELETETPVAVTPQKSIRTASIDLTREKGQCLVVEGNKVVTPWDAVMKPWVAGKLTIASPYEKNRKRN